jgi:hypothetical protein
VKPFLRTALLGVAAAVMLSACDDDDNPTANGPATESALVRVAHLSPDAPAVDVWVDGSLALEDVEFRDFSGYLELSEGMHEVVVVAANTTTPAVIDAAVNVEGGIAYTVAATGLLADSSIAPAVFEDDLEPTPGKAELRFVHASPDAPAVDITLLDGTPLFSDVSFGSAGMPVPVDAGAYSVQVRVAGTTTVALSFADVPVSAGMNYTVYAVGQLGDGSIDALVSVDMAGEATTTVDLTPATAEVRVAHLVPGAPNVDVIVDGDTALTNVPFEAISDYLVLSAATHTVRVVVAGGGADVIGETALTFDPNSASTVAATGIPSNIVPLVLQDTRELAAPGKSQVRFVHTSPDAPAVDVMVTNGPVLFAGYEFGQSSDYLEVDAGTYDLEVRVASTPPGQGAFVEAFPGVQLTSTTTYSVFATGLAANLDAKAVEDSN